MILLNKRPVKVYSISSIKSTVNGVQVLLIIKLKGIKENLVKTTTVFKYIYISNFKKSITPLLKESKFFRL